MDARSCFLCFSSALLALSSYFYGRNFVRKHNYLIGIEMWIVGTSATNAVVFFATQSPVSWRIAEFFDLFSRGFGMPIIAVLGISSITHGYKPSIKQDVALFLIAFAATLDFMNLDFMSGILPYYDLVMWTLLSVYLAYFVKRLLGVGAFIQAAGVLLALVTSQAIACIYDFYKIPGEETNVVLNFYALALNAWAYFMPAIYYAYCALERARNERVVLNTAVPCGN